MKLSKREIAQLQKFIEFAQTLIQRASSAEPEVRSSAPKRVRRSGKELVAFRKMLVAERKKGVPVSELAKTHGVSSAYIYQL